MATNTSLSIGATSTPVITESVKWMVLTNIGTTSVVWLQVWEPSALGVQPDAEVGKGIPLAPASGAGWIGGSFSLLDSQLIQTPVQAISASGTNTLAVWYV